MLGLGDSGGVQESTTGQSDEDAWSDFFTGLKDIGSWAMTTPVAKNYVMEQQLDHVKQLAEIQMKYGNDVYAQTYGTPADAIWSQLSPTQKAQTLSGGEGDSTMLWVVGGLGGLALLLYLFSKK